MARIRLGRTPALCELERSGRCLSLPERGQGKLWYYEATVYSGPGIHPHVRRTYTVVAEDDRMAVNQAFRWFAEEVDYIEV